MDAETLARWQFGITTVYHFLFVPITIALSMLVAVLQTLWYRSGEEKFLRLTKFFGKVFLINFAMGVVTGIVQEFQFGLNWSEYSRFVGDIFGAPLAMEALLAFFLESVFLGVWVFGWDRLPKKLHLMSIWLGSIGTLLSAIFILAANSFMQNPAGSAYNAANGRAEMTSLVDVLLNPINLVTFPHVIAGAYVTAGGLIVGISGWWLAKLAKAGDADAETKSAWHWSTRFGAWVLIIAGAAVIITGDLQGKAVTAEQPIKMAAAEGLCNTEAQAPFSLILVGSSCEGVKEGESITALSVPGLFSILGSESYDVNAEMLGINNLNETYTKNGFSNVQLQKDTSGALVDAVDKYNKANDAKFDFAPSIPVSFWTFRIMIVLGGLAILVGIWVLIATNKGKSPKGGSLWTAAMIATPLMALFANSFGWIFAEMGRQPFVVYGVLPTMSANSPGVSNLEVGLTMVLFTVIYGTLAVVEVGLQLHFIKKGLPEVTEPTVLTDDDAPVSFAY